MSPGLSIAHYRVTAKIGQGGMGEVWRATDTKLHRDVAIKLLPEAFAEDPDRMARFQREAQVLAALNHPNIAHVYGVEERALVMELVDGSTLAERIAQGPIPLDEALDIARQIGDALESAHEKDIIHRDLKPANIKITPDGRVKVLDFGLAKAMASDSTAGDAANSPTLTMRATVAGVILGTAGYMAPEQARGKPVDKRADIWAFGVVLYEMVSGETLFHGETVSDTLAAVLTKDPDIARVPPQLRSLLRSCLEKDPKRRLHDIGDAWRLLENAPEPISGAPSGRRFVPWIAAALATIAAIAIALLHFRETAAPAPVVRFSLSPPEKGSFGTWIALSPDGRRLAFTAAGPDGTVNIWVHDLDSLESRSLASSETAGTITMFWSPDSRFLVYQAAGKLKKIDIMGGPPQTLCDSPVVMLGGSWNSEGVILAGSNSGPVVRVSSAGGKASPVTVLDRSRSETYHSDPIFLPDGIHFLFFRHSSKPEFQGIYVGSIQAAAAEQSLKRIASSDYSIAYAPPMDGGSVGQLLVLREGVLSAQPFDQQRFETRGEPIPIPGAEQIGTSITRGFFTSSANGVLAYRTGGSATGQLTWYDRQGRAAGIAGDSADFQDPAISPDGAHVAYSRPTQGSPRQIWILDVARAAHTRLTFLNEGAHAGAWAADSRHIAFSSVSGSAIFVDDVIAGGNPRRVLDGEGNLWMNDWTRDGRFLVYTQSTNSFDVIALPEPLSAAPKTPVAITNSEFAEMHGQVSPDSRWVAYDSNESGRYEIYVRPFPPGDGRSGKWLVSSSGGQQPRWRGDGKELYYLAPDRLLMAVDLTIVDSFQAGTPHGLFQTAAIPATTLQYVYDVAADGKRFLVVTPAGGSITTPATIVLNWQSALKK